MIYHLLWRRILGIYREGRRPRGVYSQKPPNTKQDFGLIRFSKAFCTVRVETNDGEAPVTLFTFQLALSKGKVAVSSKSSENHTASET